MSSSPPRALAAAGRPRRRRRNARRGRLGHARPGAAHSLLSALALPPLVALVAAAWIAHRRLLAPSLVALVLFGARRADDGAGRPRRRSPRSRSQPRSSSASSASAASRSPSGPVARLRHAHEAADHDAAAAHRRRGHVRRRAGRALAARSSLAAMAGLALACGGASALNHVLDADIDRLMGERTEKRPVAAGRVTPARGARVRARPLGALVRAAREHRQRRSRPRSRSSATSSTSSSTPAG